METFDSFVVWLATGGGAVVLMAWLSSWLLEDWQTWAVVPPKWKKVIILAVAVVIGTSAKALELRPDITALAKPYLDTVILIVSAWLSTQVAHKADRTA